MDMYLAIGNGAFNASTAATKIDERRIGHAGGQFVVGLGTGVIAIEGDGISPLVLTGSPQLSKPTKPSLVGSSMAVIVRRSALPVFREAVACWPGFKIPPAGSSQPQHLR